VGFRAKLTNRRRIFMRRFDPVLAADAVADRLAAIAESAVVALFTALISHNIELLVFDRPSINTLVAVCHHSGSTFATSSAISRGRLPALLSS
jgi:ethanolamine utilization microcompartment shell protein EutL